MSKIPSKDVTKLCILLENIFLKLKAQIDTKRIAISFSGGLDSSILAYLAKKTGFTPTLYCLCTTHSADFVRSEKIANILNLDLHKICVSDADLLDGIKYIKKICTSVQAERIVFSVPLYFVASQCIEKHILTGQGADELFCGYLRYLKINDLKKLKQNLEIDLEKAIQILETDKCIANHFKKYLHAPYLDNDFKKFATDLRVEYKINNNIRKYILRLAAQHWHLQPDIVWCEKKAAQYSTGLMKVLRRHAKDANLKINDYLAKL
jgi:asparagine synthase (glutamine-hydrolysing)